MNRFGKELLEHGSLVFHPARCRHSRHFWQPQAFQFTTSHWTHRLPFQKPRTKTNKHRQARVVMGVPGAGSSGDDSQSKPLPKPRQPPLAGWQSADRGWQVVELTRFFWLSTVLSGSLWLPARLATPINLPPQSGATWTAFPAPPAPRRCPQDVQADRSAPAGAGGAGCHR